jgi:hypothetical protein
LRLGEEDSETGAVITCAQVSAHQGIPLHSHAGWTCLVVQEGSFVTDDGESYGPGDVRIMEPDIVYSFTAGETGVRFVEVFESYGVMTKPSYVDPSDPKVAAIQASIVDRS